MYSIHEHFLLLPNSIFIFLLSKKKVATDLLTSKFTQDFAIFHRCVILKIYVSDEEVSLRLISCVLFLELTFIKHLIVSIIYIYVCVCVCVCMHTNLPANAIGRLVPHPWSGDS